MRLSYWRGCIIPLFLRQFRVANAWALSCWQVEEADLKPLTFASHRYTSFHLLMPLYGEARACCFLYQGTPICRLILSSSCWAVCTRWEGSVQGKEGQGVEWCDVTELRRRHMPAADSPLIPAVEEAVQRHAQCSLSMAT